MDLEKYQDESVIKRIIDEHRHIAVVGLSDHVYRPSYGVSRYMQNQGYRIIPVNPKYDTVLGKKAYSDLHEVPEEVGLVNVFRRPEFVLPVVNDAIAIGARAIWLQEGVINFEAAKLAEEAGLDVVMDRCIKVEHARLASQKLIVRNERLRSM